MGNCAGGNNKKDLFQQKLIYAIRNMKYNADGRQMASGCVLSSQKGIILSYDYRNGMHCLLKNNVIVFESHNSCQIIDLLNEYSSFIADFGFYPDNLLNDPNIVIKSATCDSNRRCVKLGGYGTSVSWESS